MFSQQTRLILAGEDWGRDSKYLNTRERFFDLLWYIIVLDLYWPGCIGVEIANIQERDFLIRYDWRHWFDIAFKSFIAMRSCHNAMFIQPGQLDPFTKRSTIWGMGTKNPHEQWEQKRLTRSSCQEHQQYGRGHDNMYGGVWKKSRPNKPTKDGGSTAGLPPCNKPKDQQSN